MPRERWLVSLTEYAGVTAYSGGIGRHYASLLPALVRAGVDVALVLFVEAPLLVDTAPGGVRLVARRRLRGVPRWLAPLVRAIDFRAIASSATYDRILLPEWGGVGAALPVASPLVTNLATGMRLANVVSGIDVGRLSWRRRVEVALQSACEQRQIVRSRGVVPISRAMLEATGDLIGPLPQATVVRNCIDVGEVQDRAARSTPPPSWPTGSGHVVLFLGRLERRKGVADAAAAFALVHRTHPDARFVFAGASGDSRFEPTVQSIAREVGGAPGTTTMLGHVLGDELYAAMAAADVVVCPSRWEGFGQVALEVKALGRPLIVTSGSGFDDFCTDDVDCRMVPPAHPTALAEAVVGFLDDPALAHRLGLAARDGIGRFTADAVAPDLIDAVRLLGGPCRHAARHSTRRPRA